MKICELECCPFCGHDEYYVSEYYYGRFDFTYKFNGEQGDNSGMYDGLGVRTNKRMRCKKCDKYLADYCTGDISKMAERALTHPTEKGGEG
jgi:hypothetical protein